MEANRPDVQEDPPKGDFERVASALDPAMIIVTAATGERRGGCLVGFHTQVSIDPARLLVCISQNNRTHDVAAEASVLAVHVVPDGQEELAELFGGETGDDVDKFERCEWTKGPGGVPLIEGCEPRLVGRVLSNQDMGDHTGFVLAPIEDDVSGDASAEAVRLDDVEEIDPGHEA
jgi:flavin reductase (DIM6/NTAB) family NADH-FMN oxidoreductase RutF